MNILLYEVARDPQPEPNIVLAKAATGQIPFIGV